MSTRSRRTTGTAGVVLLLMSLVLVVLGLPAGATPGGDPPGNNGTVKIDGIEFDIHPDNEPHVGCIFQVDFYGFDAGDLNAQVTFEVQPPTGPFETVLTDTVFIGEDDHSGGGSEAGIDASETYTLDLTGYAPHPQQGWHVKLTVNAEGSIGADTKYKVFWVTDCTAPSTTSTTVDSSTTSTTVDSSTTSTTVNSSTTSTTVDSSTTSTTVDSSTTSTTVNSSTTSTTVDSSTTSTTAGSSTTASTTSTTQPAATTTSPQSNVVVSQATTTSSTAPFDVVSDEVEVLGIQVSAPVAAQVATQETLPFTGISTSSMALLALALVGIGLLLSMASRQPDERTPARSWD